MSVPDNGSEPPVEQPPGQPQDGRYVGLALAEGVLIYDRENHRAWLGSDSPVALASMV
jgi:hypothetical protein